MIEPSDKQTAARWRYFRPFANAHWTLPLALIAFWGLIIVCDHCSSGPAYIETACLSATIVISLWLADLRRGSVSGWRRACKVICLATADLLTMFLFFILLSIPLIIVLPVYQCYAEREKVSVMILEIQPIREEIESRAARTGSLKDSGAGIAVRLERPSNIGLVSSDGTIMLASLDPVAILIFTPRIVDRGVTWDCIGRPSGQVPTTCRKP